MKILMVCLGNICRSPLAEGIMQHLADKEGLNWQIDSAGTGDWHIGNGPDQRSVRTAREHGIDISQQVCRLFRKSDFDTFDQILVMDKNNLSNILAMARNADDRKKVSLLLVDQIVPDPYHDDNQFEPVFKMIEDGCRAFIKRFLNHDL
ncbi:MAG: protein tyrosine phosphatase [Mucilaginibacter sp.]|uniref:low molecular weight protein-tyrosine-phosphatase n=1 Tax=Mucilaginibacter sp. TaxID=1882438 RepID=UPI0026146B58|nr:low molecular weight protein-tyrosine-phosphatase [Mucilaginibacter sp.]MDB5001981.1 protein tyrosine phosphatase [Mucilaginibacter sp.]